MANGLLARKEWILESGAENGGGGQRGAVLPVHAHVGQSVFGNMRPHCFQVNSQLSSLSHYNFLSFMQLAFC